MKAVIVNNEGEFIEAAYEFVVGLKNMAKENRRSTATTIALVGELGAGKTAFVKASAKALGVVETVASPTFVLIKKYPLYHQPWESLVHIDAYRLEYPEELLSLDWNEFVENPKNIIFIEWADRVNGILPEGFFRIKIDTEGESRKFFLS